MATRKGTITVWKLGYAAHLRQRGRGVVTVSLIAPASEAHASEEKTLLSDQSEVRTKQQTSGLKTRRCTKHSLKACCLVRKIERKKGGNNKYNADAVIDLTYGGGQRSGNGRAGCSV